MAYIDREKALEICEKHYQHCLEMHDYCGDTTADDIKEDIEKMPTADVVEVVRCKDCKHCWNYMGIDKMHYMKCTYDPECDTPIHEMHFCSYGERSDT